MAKCAILTITYNEPDFMAMWYRYYSKHFDDADIYILDDGSDDGMLDGIGGNIEKVTDQVHPDLKKHIQDGDMQHKVLERYRLLLRRYKYVMKVDTDEFVVPDPAKWPGGLKQFIDEFEDEFAQCSGYGVVEKPGEAVFDSSKDPWLSQRTHWHRDWHHFCKVVLSRTDPQWGGGYHASKWNKDWTPAIQKHEREDFRLIHMHYACSAMTKRRWTARNSTDGRFQPEFAEKTVMDRFQSDDMPALEIPDRWRLSI
tara:strand:+ start:2682 stop:3446 length:765 start_codon:yes stop_codon:yes gene_type:complete